ncbi:MAG TPA: hypothetical protein VEF33_10130 [Syntrophales bacterium]|nr:hypothetical protein [Syntrophales bacterium]
MNYQLRSTAAVDTTHVVTEVGLVGLTKLYIDAGSPNEKSKGKLAKRKMVYTIERRQSLSDCMSATWEVITRPYFQNGYYPTPKIEKIEEKIVDLQAKVLNGKASLSDFRSAVEHWEEEVILAKCTALQGTINFIAESTGIN